METVTIKFAKVKPNAKIPSKRDEDAGYDIYPCFPEKILRIRAHETVLVPTGIASAIPKNTYFGIEERGSTGSKGIKKSAGVMDSGYRGEWFIAITNSRDIDIYISKVLDIEETEEFKNIKNKTEGWIIYPYESAIAQAILHYVIPAEIEEIEYKDLLNIKSERGTGALGSSGK